MILSLAKDFFVTAKGHQVVHSVVYYLEKYFLTLILQYKCFPPNHLFPSGNTMKDVPQGTSF